MQLLTQAIATIDVVLFLGILAVLLGLLGATLSVWWMRRTKVPFNLWPMIAVSAALGMVVAWIIGGAFRLAMNWIW
jgi:spore maturation protein SpmB